MLSRLFGENRHWRGLALGLSALNLSILIGACSGGAFMPKQSAPISAGAGGGSAGETASSAGNSGSPDEAGSDSGGASGDAGSVETSGASTNGGAGGAGKSGATSAGGKSGAGTGGNRATAGAGGKPGTSCDCTAGNYCQDGTNKCRSCTDFSQVSFRAPEKLTTLAQTALSSERFPRVADDASALFFSVNAAGKQRIFYTASPLSGGGTAVSDAGQQDTGPLLAPGFADQNFFFERLDALTGKRKLMMAGWSGTTLSGTLLAPQPINMPGTDDYSVAVAAKAKRLYWMSTRSGKPELLFYGTSSGAPPPAPFDVKTKAGANTCSRSGDDATPWVDLAGTVLLFRSESVDDNCQVNDSGAFDLFAVPLNKDGAAAAVAIPLSSLNNTGGMSTETDPSLSTDACILYFASDNGTGDFDVYRALRN
jgi:WD40-like Beta Propeller Repeat